MQQSAVALLQACAESSDAELWNRFVRLFRPRMAAAVTRALWRSGQRVDRELIAEVIQEAYCRMLVADRHVLRSFRGSTEGEAYTYVMRVAESATLDRLRAAAATKRGAGLLVAESQHETAARDVRDPAASPETRLIRRDLWRLFWERCGALIGSRDCERDLAILEQALFHGWTSREIARDRGLSASTVDTIIHRIRRRLARRGIHLPTRSGAVHEVAEGGCPDDPWRQ